MSGGRGMQKTLQPARRTQETRQVWETPTPSTNWRYGRESHSTSAGRYFWLDKRNHRRLNSQSRRHVSFRRERASTRNRGAAARHTASTKRTSTSMAHSSESESTNLGRCISQRPHKKTLLDSKNHCTKDSSPDGKERNAFSCRGHLLQSSNNNNKKRTNTKHRT